MEGKGKQKESKGKEREGLILSITCKTHEVLSPLPPEKLCYGRHGCVEIHWHKKTDKCYIQNNPRKPFPYNL